MTSETLAQYSALMVMKHLYGPDKIRRFLKYELDNYLRSRQAEAVEEVPLERVENQQYIHYRKGAVVMYLLQERLGEDAVDRALVALRRQVALQGPALPALARPHRRVPQGSEDARAAAADHRPVREDHALRPQGHRCVDQARTRPAGPPRSPSRPTNIYANGKGVETKARLAEPIEVGLFTARPGPRRLLVEGRDHDGAAADRERRPSRSCSTARRSRPSPASTPIISTSTATATTM